MAEIKTPFLCVLPWVQVFVKNDGSLGLCPMNQNNEAGDLHTVKYEMAQGKVPAACEACAKQELSGKSSYRNFSNQLYSESYAKLLANGTSSETPVETLDLRLGNRCNLKCRMCHPRASRLLKKEFDSFFREDGNYDFSNSLTIAERLICEYPELKSINIAGGEPFADQDVVNFIHKLSLTPRAHEIKLTLNTNVTRIAEIFFEASARFKTVEIAASIDALGALNEYIRFPSRWSDILQNLRIHNSRVKTYVNCTVQAYNIFNLEKFLDFFVNTNKIHVHLSLLTEPEYLAINCLPEPLKMLAKDHIEKCIQRFPDRKDLKGIKNFLLTDLNEECFKNFIKWTRHLDFGRKQSLEEIVPEFKGYV